MPTLEERVFNLETIIDDLPEILNIRFNHASSERAQLRADIARLEARFDALESKVDDLSSDVKALVTSVGEFLRRGDEK